ncbi:MAG: chlorite dismutase family protein [Chloroflexota bacterium]|nr:MAG: chlorite dismutase family protein [Chloroflexota bacterium]
MRPEEPEQLDLSEKGRTADGRVISSDKRLFMQLLAYGGCQDPATLIEALTDSGLDAVLYVDINDPQGIGLLTISRDPGEFIGRVRQVLNRPPFVDLHFKPEYTMLGRTYALGHEEDLEQALIRRPRARVHNSDLPWAIWYPLRRSGAFAGLSAQEQRVILMEHGGVGRAYGRAGYGYDVRLACYGLDKNDNDFVIGLLGPELYPLSSIVQRMRKTKQTSKYLERLGPFFVGNADWQSEANLNERS